MKLTEITAKQFQAKLKDPVLFDLKAKIKDLRKQVSAYGWKVRASHKGEAYNYCEVTTWAADMDDVDKRSKVYDAIAKIFIREIATGQVDIDLKPTALRLDIHYQL